MHTSHNVRDDRGFVCCPTLKSIICTYCGIKGHGPKYCLRLEKDKKEQQRVLSSKSIKQAVKKVPAAAPAKKTTMFGALELSSSDSETDDEVVAAPVTKPVAVPKVAVVVTSRAAPWATQEVKTIRWTDMDDSADEDETDED